MMLADVPPPVSPSPALWIALAALAVAAVSVFVIMRPVRGWRRFAARHGLTFVDDVMRGEIGGRPIEVTLDRSVSPPKTRFKAGALEREAVGRASEAWLERAASDAASLG